MAKSFAMRIPAALRRWPTYIKLPGNCQCFRANLLSGQSKGSVVRILMTLPVSASLLNDKENPKKLCSPHQ